VNGARVEHIPVLVNELAEHVNLPPDGVVVDATIGQGGHSLLFGQKLGPEGVIVGLDVDTKSISRARFILKDLACKVILIRGNFSRIGEHLDSKGIAQADFILADLGVSSGQLADTERGLSFQTNMPLDMRIDKRIGRTAADIIRERDEKSLADLIYGYGGERASRRIARFIVRRRREGAITTTGQLAAIVCRALGRTHSSPRGRLHPATRTFQALRIAVNDELGNLSKLLEAAPGLLKSGGRIAVISYHSLEDGLVKKDFRLNEKSGIYGIITKKLIVASRREVAENRRARSAKLRIAERQ
jgi:16S rRNA (cytosine1402-N4)-methyltransferase